jgi:hypothetical protein
MLRFIFVCPLLLFAACSAPSEATQKSSGTIKGVFVGCSSESNLDEFQAAKKFNDLDKLNSLLGYACIPIEGKKYNVIERGDEKSSIRVFYETDTTFVLWVIPEAID